MGEALTVILCVGTVIALFIGFMSAPTDAPSRSASGAKPLVTSHYDRFKGLTRSEFRKPLPRISYLTHGSMKTRRAGRTS